MIKKVLIIFVVVILCLFIPISCVTCKAIVKAEEKTNVSLTAIDGTVEGYSPVYYLLGGLPYEDEFGKTMNISAQSIILYNEHIALGASGDIYETKLIVPVRTSSSAVSIVDVSLGQTGYEGVVLPTGSASVNVAFNSGKGNSLNQIFTLNCTFRFYQLDRELPTYYSNFNDIMYNVSKVKRFNYINQGYYYCAFQFFIENDEPAFQLYVQFPLGDRVSVEAYESWLFPQATLDLEGYIASELDGVYNQGFNAGYSSREPFQTIVNGVNDFLNIKLFGKFTFGTIFGIIVALSMLFIGLHLFRG